MQHICCFLIMLKVCITCSFICSLCWCYTYIFRFSWFCFVWRMCGENQYHLTAIKLRTPIPHLNIFLLAHKTWIENPTLCLYSKPTPHTIFTISIHGFLFFKLFRPKRYGKIFDYSFFSKPFHKNQTYKIYAKSNHIFLPNPLLPP